MDAGRSQRLERHFLDVFSVLFKTLWLCDFSRVRLNQLCGLTAAVWGVQDNHDSQRAASKTRPQPCGAFTINGHITTTLTATICFGKYKYF